MKTHSWRAVFLILWTVTLAAGIASAQVATGTPAFGSYGGGPFDTVDLGNANVHFSVPVLHKAGRGMPFAYDLVYDSSIWTAVGSQWQPAFNWGWIAQSAVKVGYATYVHRMVSCGLSPSGGSGPLLSTYYDVWNHYVYHDPWGIVHKFPPLASTQNDPHNCNGGTISTLEVGAVDGSGYTLSASYGNVSIITKSGAVITPPTNLTGGYSGQPATVTDANGNQISVSSTSNTATFTDTLGTTAISVSGSSPVTFSYTAPSGGQAQYTLNYQQYTVKTNFGFTSSPAITEYGPLANALVDNIQLPDGSEYKFTYEKTPGSCTPLQGTYQQYCVTGRIASVTLPTGGIISYTYSGGTHNTGIYSDGSTATLARAVSPATSCSSGGCWQYARAQISGNHWRTTVTSPPDPVNPGSASDVTLIDFQQDSNTTNPTYNFYETQRTINQGSSMLLATVTKCYNTNYANCSTTAVSSPITQTDVYSSLPNGSTRASEVVYNSYGSVTDSKEYNYGVALGAKPSSTYLVRETSISYASLGNGIVNKPASVTVYDKISGTTLASSNYTYDQGTPTGTSGTPQHVSITGSRGNVTTATTSTSSTASLSRTYTYYDTGNPYVATDVNSAQTTSSTICWEE